MALRLPPTLHPGQKPKWWWYPIDGDVSQTTNRKDWWLVFRLKKGFFRFGYGFTWVMVKAGLGSLLPICSCLFLWFDEVLG